MNVFVLGGYGKTGLPIINMLSESDLVSKVAVAGRDLERAKAAAKDLGEKGIAVQADGTNEQGLISLLDGYDFIVNAARNEAVVPSIKAAIHHGVNYCDMAWAGILKDAGELAPQAEAANITAIIATGISPCITNLMGVYAQGKLDEVVQLQIGRADIYNFQKGSELSRHQWLEDPEESLVALEEFRSTIGWLLKRVQENGIRLVIAYQDGKWVEVDPFQNNLEVPLARGGTKLAHPYLTGDDFWGMLPTEQSQFIPVEMSFSPFPPQLGAVLQDLAKGILRGEIDAETAITSFFETIEGDPHRWLTLPGDTPLIAKIWVRALGRKNGRAAKFDCWFTDPMWDVNGYYLTSVSLVAAVRKVMRGEMKLRGVHTAEKAFDPKSFFDEVVTLLSGELPDGRMIDESFEWLE